MITIIVGDRWTRIEGLPQTMLIDLLTNAPEPPIEIKDYLRSVTQNLLYLDTWATTQQHLVDWRDPQSRVYEAKAMRFLGQLRTQPPGEYERNWPFKTTCDRHQIEFFAHARQLKNIALAPAAVGVGKTKMAIDVAADKFLRGEIIGLIVVAPNGVHRQWVTKGLPVHMTEKVPYMAHVWSPTRQLPKGFEPGGRELIKRMRVLTFNIEAFSATGRKAAKELARFLSKGPWMLAIDECFLAGTKISTPGGDRDIETLRAEDVVLSSTGRYRIKSVFQGLTTRFVILHLNRGGQIRCTENHPFFTRVGWVRAADMRGHCVSSPEDVRRVWGAVQTDERGASSRTSLLREILLSEMAHAPTRNTGSDLHAGNCRQGFEGSYGAPNGAGAVECRETSPGNYAPTHVSNLACDEAQTFSTGWEWSAPDESSCSSSGDHGRALDHGVRHRIGAEAQRLSDLLQSRYRAASEEMGDRGRWRRPSSIDQTSPGSEEGAQTPTARVDRVEIVECLHPIATYDLEIEGTPHFYVEGALVHNSQRIKNSKAERTKQLTKLAPLAAVRMIMTGTPVTRNFTDFYSQYNFLDERIIGLSHYIAFRNRYCVTIPVPHAPRGAVKIVGHKNVEELFRKIAPVTFMVPDSVLGLQKPWRLQREVALTGEQREVYGLLADKLVFDLKERNIETPQNALTRLLRMQQVLCGRVYGEHVDNDGIETAVAHNIASNRPAALIEFLEEHDGAAVIWARFQQDIDDIAGALDARAAKARASTSPGERRWNYVVYDGRVSAVADREARVSAFARGEVDYFLGNPAAGGTGVDGLQDSCSLMVYYSNSFNREIRWQSEGRVQRRGQKGHVGIVDLVAPGTVDELFLKAYESTEELAAMVLRSPEILARGV